MRLTLTDANTAYVAPGRAVGTSGAGQTIRSCVICNGSAAVVYCGGSGAIIGGAAETVGLPLAAGDKLIIPTQGQLWFSSGSAGTVVDYEYF